MKGGYVLVLVLLVVALLTTIVTRLSKDSILCASRSHSIREQEQARVLARSGIEIAISQLARPKTPSAKSAEKNQTVESTKDFLIRLVPVLNAWQTFELKEPRDGIDAQLSIRVCSEDGKLNLNGVCAVLDNKIVLEQSAATRIKQAYIECFKKIGTLIKVQDIWDMFMHLRDQRKRLFEDVSELIAVGRLGKHLGEFVPFEVHGERTVYLYDLFTVWSERGLINPWTMSTSLQLLSDLQKPSFSSEKGKHHDEATKALSGFKDPAQWPEQWSQQLESLYRTSDKSIPRWMFHLWDTECKLNTFSVQCRVKVGRTVQQLFAVLIKKGTSQKDEPPYEIRKIYWI